jgi:hypothetical protein
LSQLEKMLRLRRSQLHQPSQLLEMLEQKLASRPRAIELRLHLQSGAVLEGQLVQYLSKGRQLLLVQKGDLTWIRLDEVQALTLVDWESWLADLTAGQVMPVQGTAPTKLQLRRQAETLREKIAPVALHIPWDSLPDEDGSALHLQQLLHDIGSCWDKIASDKMGQDSLKNVRQIQIEVTNSPCSLALANGILRIFVCRAGEGWLSYPHSQLLRDWEKWL